MALDKSIVFMQKDVLFILPSSNEFPEYSEIFNDTDLNLCRFLEISQLYSPLYKYSFLHRATYKIQVPHVWFSEVDIDCPRN